MKQRHLAENGLRLISYLQLYSLSDNERALFRYVWPIIYNQCDQNIFQTTAIIYASYLPQIIEISEKEFAEISKERANNFIKAIEDKDISRDIHRAKSLTKLLKSYGDSSLN